VYGLNGPKSVPLSLTVYIDSLLEQKVCLKTPEEELIKEMWDAARVDERKSLAMVLLKLIEREC